jgi:hypothetical protein
VANVRHTRLTVPADRLLARFLLAVMLASVLSGCRKARIICLRTDVVPTANKNQPVAVDVVLVRDKDLIKKLMSMPAADWFE